MTTTDSRPDATTARPPSWWAGRAGLIIPAILAAFSTYLLVGIVTMQVPPGVTSPGPKFFPTLIVIAGYIIAVLLTIQMIRNPEPPAPAVYSPEDDVSDDARAEAEAASRVNYRTFSDWTSIAWAAGGVLAFALLLGILGWILAAALLFWCVARAMGSKKLVMDIVVALTMSSVAYLAFDVLLGLNLPSGLLGGF